MEHITIVMQDPTPPKIESIKVVYSEPLEHKVKQRVYPNPLYPERDTWYEFYTEKHLS